MSGFFGSGAVLAGHFFISARSGSLLLALVTALIAGVLTALFAGLVRIFGNLGFGILGCGRSLDFFIHGVETNNRFVVDRPFHRGFESLAVVIRHTGAQALGLADGKLDIRRGNLDIHRVGVSEGSVVAA